MHTVEFLARIKNGVVNIPKEIKELQNTNARFIVITDIDNKNEENLKKTRLSSISIKTNGFKFNRSEANER